jgi:hypothetical protein
MPSHHIEKLWFESFILVAVVFEVCWYLFVRRRRYPWGEMVTSVATYALRIPARLLRPLLVTPVAFFAVVASNRDSAVEHGLGSRASLSGN